LTILREPMLILDHRATTPRLRIASAVSGPLHDKPNIVEHMDMVGYIKIANHARLCLQSNTSSARLPVVIWNSVTLVPVSKSGSISGFDAPISCRINT
jgi:hypothetical protein